MPKIFLGPCPNAHFPFPFLFNFALSFSKLKLIGTYLRSTMDQDWMSNLALLSIERKFLTSEVEKPLQNSSRGWFALVSDIDYLDYQNMYTCASLIVSVIISSLFCILKWKVESKNKLYCYGRIQYKYITCICIYILSNLIKFCVYINC